MAKLKSQGTGIYLGDGASPQVYTEIAQVTNISGPDGSANEIDVTTLDSAAKEYLIGLADEGNVTLDVVFDSATTATQHAALRTARNNGTTQHFQIRLTDSPRTTLTFDGLVSAFSLDVQTDDAIRASYTLRITGAVT